MSIKQKFTRVVGNLLERYRFGYRMSEFRGTFCDFDTVVQTEHVGGIGARIGDIDLILVAYKNSQILLGFEYHIVGIQYLQKVTKSLILLNCTDEQRFGKQRYEAYEAKKYLVSNRFVYVKYW
jgi:hypothetical protein